MSDPNYGVLEHRNGLLEMRFERRLGHPVERVWRALTDPAELLGWWGEVETDLVEGGPFVVRWLNTDEAGERFVMRATVVRVEPPRLLETRGEPHGLLRWELRPDGAGTVLSFASVLDPAEVSPEYRAKGISGWHYHLDGLAEHLAGGTVELAGLPNERWHDIHAHYTVRAG